MLVLNATPNEASKSTLQKTGSVIPWVFFKTSKLGSFGTWKAVKATGTVSILLQPSNGETVVIGGKTYTFKTTITTTDGDVALGAALVNTQQNLVAAINQTGVPGTQYGSGTRPNQYVVASDFSSNVCTLTAKDAGVAGNSITLSETMAGAGNVVSGATLTGGADATNADDMLVPRHDQFNPGAYQPNVDSYLSEYLLTTSNSQERRWLSSLSQVQSLADNIATGATYKYAVANWLDSYYKKVTAIQSAAYLQNIANISSGHGLTITTNGAVLHAIGSTNNKVVAVMSDNGTTKAIVGTVNTTTGDITWGTAVAISSNNTISAKNWRITELSTDKFAIVYNVVTSGNCTAVAFTLSGTTITLGTPVTLEAMVPTYVDIATIGTDKFVAVYNNNSTNTKAVVCTVSGTTITVGTPVAISANTCYDVKVLANGTDKFQVLYHDAGSTPVGLSTRAATVVGTTITFGTALTIAVTNSTPNTSYDSNYRWLRRSVDNFLIVTTAWENPAVSGATTFEKNMYIVTVSGTTSTRTTVGSLPRVSTSTGYMPSGIDYMWMWEITANTRYSVIYYDQNYSRLMTYLITLSGNTIVSVSAPMDASYNYTNSSSDNVDWKYYPQYINTSKGFFTIAGINYNLFWDKSPYGYLFFMAHKTTNIQFFRDGQSIGTFAHDIPFTFQTHIPASSVASDFMHVRDMNIGVKNTEADSRSVNLNTLTLELE